MRRSHLLFLFLLLGPLWGMPCGLNADEAAVVNAMQKNTWTLMGSVANNLLYALLNYAFVGIFFLWLILNWAVLTLYTMVGTYLIPIWDFSNTAAFLDPSVDRGLIAVVSVPPVVSEMLWACVPFIVGFAIVLMAGLSIQSITRQAFAGEDALASYGGLFVGVGLLVAFPLLYSAPIVLGNQLGRGFYAATLGPNGVVTKHEKENTTSFMGVKSSRGAGGWANTLLGSNFFNPDAVNTASVVDAAKSIVGGSAEADGITDTAGLAAMLSSSLNAADNENIGSTLDAARKLTTGRGVRSTLSSAKGAIASAGAGAGATVDAVGKASDQFVLDEGKAMLQLLATRIIQIILSIMGIIGLFGLLILKGTQVLAIVLNFFLAPIACAMYVSPSTRSIFWGWVKAHVTVCLWSFLWALLLVVIQVMSFAAEGLQGMIPNVGKSTLEFAPVGPFLMPFFLFAGIKKFASVSALADSLTMTGGMASSVAGQLQSGFSSTWKSTPGAISSIGGNELPGKAGSYLQAKSAAFSSAAQGALSKVSGGLATAGGPVGLAAAAALSAGGKVAGAVSKGASKAGTMAQKLNPLKQRIGMNALGKAEKSKKPPRSRQGGGGSAPSASKPNMTKFEYAKGLKSTPEQKAAWKPNEFGD